MNLLHTLTLVASWLVVGAANAQPTCSFALLDGKPLIGASASVFARVLGPATHGKYKGEKGWGLSYDDIANVRLQAAGAVEALITTYGGKVVEAELIYGVVDLTESTRKLEAKISECAEQRTSDCWIDRQGKYYIVVGHEDRLSLFFGDKRLAGPGERRAPTRCVR